MIFRQLFEKSSYSYTYLIACPDTGKTLLIDPVLETVDRDLKVLHEMGLTLTATLETHIHADHITGATKLSALTDCEIAGPGMDNLPCRDISITEGKPFRLGNLDIYPLHTPGHTDTHHAYLISTPMHEIVFSGDCLLIGGCGRTDFQAGSAATLYNSIHNKLFTLPEDSLIYPGHDYKGHSVSTIGQEKRLNPRLGQNRPLEEFVAIMDGLNLPNPKKIEFAVPGNQQCGKCPDNLPSDMERLCEVNDQG